MFVATHACSCAGADVDRVKREIEEVIGIDCSNAIYASAKQVTLKIHDQFTCSCLRMCDGKISTRSMFHSTRTSL